MKKYKCSCGSTKFMVRTGSLYELSIKTDGESLYGSYDEDGLIDSEAGDAYCSECNKTVMRDIHY